MKSIIFRNLAVVLIINALVSGSILAGAGPRPKNPPTQAPTPTPPPSTPTVAPDLPGNKGPAVISSPSPSPSPSPYPLPDPTDDTAWKPYKDAKIGGLTAQQLAGAGFTALALLAIGAAGGNWYSKKQLKAAQEELQSKKDVFVKAFPEEDPKLLEGHVGALSRFSTYEHQSTKTGLNESIKSSTKHLLKLIKKNPDVFNSDQDNQQAQSIIKDIKNIGMTAEITSHDLQLLEQLQTHLNLEKVESLFRDNYHAKNPFESLKEWKFNLQSLKSPLTHIAHSTYNASKFVLEQARPRFYEIKDHIEELLDDTHSLKQHAANNNETNINKIVDELSEKTNEMGYLKHHTDLKRIQDNAKHVTQHLDTLIEAAESHSHKAKDAKQHKQYIESLKNFKKAVETHAVNAEHLERAIKE